MRVLPNGAERQALIDRMVDILRADAPWVAGFYPQQVVLNHAWTGNLKPNDMATNTLKYQRLDPALRARLRDEWNRPRWAPIVIVGALVLLLAVPVLRLWRRRLAATARHEAGGP
jgi:hypothetical protein